MGMGQRSILVVEDEPLHAIAGWLQIHEKDFRVDPEDPPLWKYWAALPTRRSDVVVSLKVPPGTPASNPYYGPLTGIPDEAFDKIIGNNVKSVLWLAGMTLEGMAQRGGGSFIVVGSIGGLVANTVIGAYGMSKAADHHLVKVHALGEPHPMSRAPQQLREQECPVGGVAGVLEEGRVDAGVPHHHGHPVEAALLRHRRTYDVLRGVDDLHEVHAGPPAELVADTDEGVQWGVARPGTEPPSA